MKWENVTSYSRNDKDKTARSWAAKAGQLRIVVTRHCHFPADVWVLNCNPFFEQHELKCKEIAEAKQEALALVDIELSQALGAITT